MNLNHNLMHKFIIGRLKPARIGWNATPERLERKTGQGGNFHPDYLLIPH